MVARVAQQAGETLARAREEHANAGGAQPEHRGDLAVVGAFDVRQPHHLSLARLESREEAADVEPQRLIPSG